MLDTATPARNPSLAGDLLLGADLARLLALNAAIEAASLGEAGRVMAADALLAGEMAQRLRSPGPLPAMIE
jgi:hypothetical protein